MIRRNCGQADIEKIEAARKKYADDWISGGAVKMMVDGVIESHTAAMLEPYTDDPSLKGKLFWDPDKYKAAVAELDKRGLQLFTHAIGDYGVRTALDAYENAEKVNGTQDRRPRIEHIETIQAVDIPRFGKLGVIASMQPLHSYPNDDTLNVWARNIGPDRAGRAWVWKSIADDGGHLAFGSDWPVVTLNPWEGVQTAVTRQTKEGTPDGGFVPSQRLSVADAVYGYTLGAAFAGRREKTEGSIETGKLADIIILSQNIFDVDPHKISDTKVTSTIVGGRIVYQGDSKVGDSVSQRCDRRMQRENRMKRAAFAAIFVLAILFAGCGPKTETLSLLVWEGYADPSFLKAFEDAHHCKVVASYMGSSDELVAKLRGGSAGNYDVISPSSDVATSIVRAGLAAPLDLSKIPAYPQLSARLRESPLVKANGQTYGVPFVWGPNPLLYDTNAFPKAPESWSDLWNPKLKGQDFAVG